MKLTLLNARDVEGKFVDGYEVLSSRIKDVFLERGDIEWVEGGEHEGKVGKDVRDEGAVVLKGNVKGNGKMDAGREEKSVGWVLLEDSEESGS